MIELDNSAEKRKGLVQRLKSAGCEILENGERYLDPSIAGDFSLPLETVSPNPDVLQRAGFTEFIVDSSLSHSISVLALEKEVVEYLSSGASPELKYSYLGALGAQNWLDLSDDPTYRHSELNDILRVCAGAIVEACNLSGQRVDFVSLGSGDGKLDLTLLGALQRSMTVAHYYPLDLSIELLQCAVQTVLETGAWFKKDFGIKAIHGDFNSLIRYKPIYSFDPAVNFISLVGYTFGNHNETTLLQRLREGMNPGDYLLIDALLHQQSMEKGAMLSKEQFDEITYGYRHQLNNVFAFGPVATTTIADARSVEFKYDINSRFTAVPKALNVVTYVENLRTQFRRPPYKKLNKNRLNLAVTTMYDDTSLGEWLRTRGFELVWRIQEKKTAFYLLRKTIDEPRFSEESPSQ